MVGGNDSNNPPFLEHKPKNVNRIKQERSHKGDNRKCKLYDLAGTCQRKYAEQ